MPSWRTVHNRRRRPPRRAPWKWYYGEAWIDPYRPMILPEQIPDILAYGRCITRFKGDGTVERVDPNDIYYPQT